VREAPQLSLLVMEKVGDAVRGRPHRLVQDRSAATKHPRHIRHQPVRGVNRALEIVDEDRSLDRELVA